MVFFAWATLSLFTITLIQIWISSFLWIKVPNLSHLFLIIAYACAAFIVQVDPEILKASLLLALGVFVVGIVSWFILGSILGAAAIKLFIALSLWFNSMSSFLFFLTVSPFVCIIFLILGKTIIRFGIALISGQSGKDFPDWLPIGIVELARGKNLPMSSAVIMSFIMNYFLSPSTNPVLQQLISFVGL